MSIVNFTNTVPLPLSDAMYDTLVKTVLASYPRACIVMIDKVQIPEVNADYERKQAEFGSASQEFSLWHGTREANVESICTSGFQPQKGRTMAYGDGIYFAKEFAYSWHYAKDEFRLENQTDLSYIFLGKVLPGRVYASQGHRGPAPQGYDSCANTDQSIFAIPQAAQMKPEYLIRFHKRSETSVATPLRRVEHAEELDEAEMEKRVAKMMRSVKSKITRNLRHQ